MNFNVSIHEHQIEISASNWSGREQVLYDGRVISDKRSFQNTTIHSFEAEEDGAKVVYEVNLLTLLFRYGYIVRRNGIIVAHEP